MAQNPDKWGISTQYEAPVVLLKKWVDFHWEVDGKLYDFSIPGGGYVSFTDLVDQLGVAGEDEGGDTGDAARAFVANVVSVAFSSPELLWVGKADTGTTVGALKEANGLTCEYSADLTEEQIEDINSTAVESGDWALISMQPFSSTESLTVAMNTGEVFEIRVTDAQIRKTVIDASGDTWEVTVTYGEDARIPDGSGLSVEEIFSEDDRYAGYLEQAAKAAQDADGAEEAAAYDLRGYYARFFDIAIVNGGNKVEPSAAVKVDIKLANTPETDEAWQVVHFDAAGPVVMDSEIVSGSEKDAVEMAFDTDGFSVYGVITVPSAQPDPDVTDLDGKSFTISHDSRYVTTNITPIENGNNTNGFGKTSSASQAATWYFEQPNGSGGSAYYIYTLVDGEKQYLNLTKNGSNTQRANASLSGNPQTFTVARDGDTYRLSTQSNGTTYYLDEHNGNSGNAFAGWSGPTDNGRLNLNFSSQPVMQDNGQYMTLVKYNGKYYIVNNDCSLTEVKYDEATKTVEVDDPMLWTVNRNNPNGHIYFNSTEAGFDGNQVASDWYRRYLDPSSEEGYLEESNESGPGHVDIDPGTPHYAQGAGLYMEHHVTNRSAVESSTTVNIDNTSTSDSTLYNIYHGDKSGDNYLGVVANADGTLRLAGQQSSSNAAEFVFATPTEVKDVGWTNNTVNHIDISIAGTADVSIPLAYGKYYGSAGDAEEPILTVSDNIKIELSEAQMVNRDQLRITANDMKRATITAARADNGMPIDDAFYITGYSGNVANGTSNDQVRIEGSFLVADLRGTDYEYVEAYRYNNYGNQSYKNAVNSARKANIVEYTVTVVKPLTYNLIDPELGQLYDADGTPITVTVDVAFSASFNYWDSDNECPAVNGATGFGGAEWQNGGIEQFNLSGMDFVLGGNADDPNSPLTALEITKVIMDESGNRIELKVPVTNYFDIYEKKNATNDQKNGVAGLHVVDSLNHPEWEADSRDATVRDGYTYWRTKHVTVDDSGSAIVFDFNATDAMYYIVEKHDEESLPQTVLDKSGEEWVYVKTYIETEYVRRDDDRGTHDEYSNKTLHPQAMHITEDYTRDSEGDYAYASIPEVAGKFIKLDGTEKKEGFLEFYVYNIYEKVVSEADVTLKKVDKADVDNDDPDCLKGASFTLSKYTDETFQVKDTEWGTLGSKTLSDDKNPDGTYTLNGIFNFEGLTEGFYKLEEKNFPAGYVKLSSDPTFKVEVTPSNTMEITLLNNPDDLLRLEEDKLTIVVGNVSGVALPNTGGPGTRGFTALGSILILGAGLLLLRRRRLA